MRAIFLDKDGTLIEDVPYNSNPDLIRLTAGAGQGLRLLQWHGYRLYLVTNQSGVAKGYFPESALPPVFDRIRALLEEQQVHLDGVYYCPHFPGADNPFYAQRCCCRKPLPGMLLRAAQEHAIDLPSSWMIGDILHDIEAGRRAGCKTALIDNGNETEWELSPVRMPDLVAGDLYAAAQMICGAVLPHTLVNTGRLLRKNA